MLSLRAINQFYGQNHTLWDVDLDLMPGSCTAVLGQHGMGKTTLVNCIMGYLPVNSGTMTWQEKNAPPRDLNLQPSEQRAGMGIGYVPQARNIFSRMSVEDNLMIALKAARSNGPLAIPPMIFDLFPHLYDLRHQRSGDLSPDQQQQLTLARALVLQPKLLILDEPTEGMSPWLEEDMGNLLRCLNHQYGMTILLLGQRVSFIRRVADYFLLLHRGRNVATGRVAQLDEGMINKWLT
ncbi:ATP-binding component of an ABC superfamily urea transporter [Tatumella ptyseos ATCC 33301]|uniref:ATP-binding component of an ABC superfamily urea transporter n=2 Tax=Tatumella ptyseos TaxID=82987 RepID=A0A085JC81_9GAMM|nr:ATP-binding cassette domain-containing protein [Tatumella ptyseos]KFD18077.1 ATP-binding component of an ABC superfamily urea transporter [Tatumella ptyseos ATCC 33301]SQK74040.1 LIV-I protein F [Tatumella ptyseos]